MRNIIGGLVGALVGSSMIVILLALLPTEYPSPFGLFWMVFSGSDSLLASATGLLSSTTWILYVMVWIAIGLVTAPFAESEWNAVRTALWVGVFLSVFAISSALVLDPSLWTQDRDARNIYLVLQFASGIAYSLLSLVSSIPLARLLQKARRKSDVPPPIKIETICECGAIFKSAPLMCAECGRILRNEPEAV
ncbi:MAG: hypothetical protein KAU89_01630 [Candidatus Thorarchaeota archaeon]|jgi:hypothetical protein|nr:hypothetical protein [Candidatus Thorarchaeota archaeon]